MAGGPYAYRVIENNSKKRLRQYSPKKTEHSSIVIEEPGGHLPKLTDRLLLWAIKCILELSRVRHGFLPALH